MAKSPSAQWWISTGRLMMENSEDITMDKCNLDHDLLAPPTDLFVLLELVQQYLQQPPSATYSYIDLLLAYYLYHTVTPLPKATQYVLNQYMSPSYHFTGNNNDHWRQAMQRQFGLVEDIDAQINREWEMYLGLSVLLASPLNHRELRKPYYLREFCCYTVQHNFLKTHRQSFLQRASRIPELNKILFKTQSE